MITLLPDPDTATSAPRSEKASRAPSRSASFRPDIEGLRAIAVLFVLAFHAHIPGLNGGFVGVDIFFVISGYLITGQLFREVAVNGRIKLGSFYARRARRIIPPAALVIGTTGIAAWFLMPQLAVFRLAKELLASLFYVANWNFIAQGKDYLAGSTSDSPVLHVWSLAVEEQFYLVWPFLVLLAGFVAVRRGWSPKWVVGLTLAVVTAGSFALSLALTASDPALAYMATYTRAWQFGVGALLAIFLPSAPATPERHRPAVGLALTTIVGIGGLTLMVVALVGTDDATAYPGMAALLPTLGSAAVIAAGPRSLAGVLMQLPGLRLIGRWSYSWYLWHWPALTLIEAHYGHLTWPERVLITIGAGVLAALTYTLLEQPSQRARTLRTRTTSAGAFGGLAMVLAVGLTLGVGAGAASSLGVRDSAVDQATFAQVFGAASSRDAGQVTPSPLNASGDVPARANCLVDRGTIQPVCTFGKRGGTPVVLFGDSHAHQWQPALQQLAQERGWELTVIAKSGCPVANIAPRPGSQARFSQPECVQWRAEQIEHIAAMKPSVVMFSELNLYIPQYSELIGAWRDSLDKLRESGAHLVYIRDTPLPTPGHDVPECVSGALDNWSKCSFVSRQGKDPVIDLVQRGNYSDVGVVDLDGYLCGTAKCPAVRNGTLLYRDDSHITATAARLLVPAMWPALHQTGAFGKAGARG